MESIDNILISVIVPVYNVEQYLDECMESIIAQTHKNIEIILVDDGSPDKSPAMCDAWAERDNRILVVHKKNGGLSSARNAGLDVATGEYIACVDSDDTIEHDMIETLLEYAVDEGIDIVSQVYERNVNPNKPMRQSFNRNAAICAFLDLYIPTGVPFKLIKRDVIGDTRFYEGRNNEDFDFCLNLFEKIDKVGLLNRSMYNYRVNEASISHSVNAKYFDQIFIYSLHKDALMSNPITADAAMRYEWRMMLHIAHVLRKTGNTKKFADEYKLCHDFVRQNFWRMLRHPRMRWTTKVKALLNVL